MQAHESNDQCAETVNPDRRRDDARSAVEYANLVAISQAIDASNGKVHLAEPGKPFNLSANLSGKGGAAA